MDYVNAEVMSSLALDMMSLSNIWPGACNVWRYMICALQYPIHTVVIGQCPYDTYLLPHLAAAFSQAEHTKHTPTTTIFGLHFEELGESSINFIRSTWKLLPKGYMFINADYMPSNLGGGDRGIACVLRVNRIAEFIFYCVANLRRYPEKFTILCMGGLALTCASDLSRRLRTIGVNVNQLNCKQPAALDRITKYRDSIGKKENYNFCQGRALELFRVMITRHSLLSSTKAQDILSLALSNMSSNPISPMTKSSLTNIVGDINSIYNVLESMSITNSSDKITHREKELTNQLMLLTKSVGELTNLLVGDAYTYKVLVEGQTSQIPMASREQLMPLPVDSGYEVRSIGLSDMTSYGEDSSSTNDIDKDAQIDALFSSPAPKRKSTPKSTKKSRNQINTINSSSKTNVALRDEVIASVQAENETSNNKSDVGKSNEMSTLNTDLDALFSSEFITTKSPDMNRIGRRLKKV